MCRIKYRFIFLNNRFYVVIIYREFKKNATPEFFQIMRFDGSFKASVFFLNKFNCCSGSI